MKKTIIFLLLIFFAINLKAKEEIELQWEDITPGEEFVLEREIFFDNNDNIYTKPYYYLYKYSNSEKKWSTIEIPEIAEDFKDKIKVFVNYKSDLVIYSINKNEIFIKNNNDSKWQKYVLDFGNDTLNKLEFIRITYYDNSKVLLYAISNELNYYGNIHIDLNTQEIKIYSNQLYVYPSDYIYFNNKKNEFIGITDNKIGFLDVNLKIIGETRNIDESNNFLDLNTDTLIPYFAGLNENKINYICKEEDIISIYQTSDFGLNWSLFTKTKILDDFSIYRRLSYIKNNFIVIVLQNNLNKSQISMLSSDDFGKNWFISDLPLLPDDGFTEYSYCFLNNYKELILATNSKIYKTNLSNTSLSIENSPSLKNLSVLYGNISDNILNINIESGINSDAKISLYSSDMRAIEQFNEVNFLQGINELTFKINSELSTGVYYVFIESGNYKHFYRIIK